ncbi:MAG TPA: ectoine/hydroxyectoine ABC transporter substrate-binding protein EhuB [Rhizobiaceae bacterium]|nr:ectoine/hydroxyectoine ABC transporter substrate-binding protein EhuB [Rhizobiaceae bacterium]
MLRTNCWGSRVLATCLVLAGVSAATTEHSFAETTLERIVSSGKITIGIHNRAPWGFRGPDGQLTGFHPDMIRATLGPLGVKEVDFVIADLGALIPSLLAERVDAVASGFSITPARCEQVAFSEPDLMLGDALLVKAGNPQNIHSYADIVANPKLSIGGSRGSSNLANAMAAGIPEAQVQQFQNTESSVSAVLAGRVDAVTFSSATVTSVLKDPKVAGLERATPFQGYVKPNGQPAVAFAGIAFRKTDSDLVEAYNKRLAELKADGTLLAIVQQYGFTADELAPASVKTEALCAGGQ